ncbi:hypothetical protein R0131_10685 [Clostridium sp. AL.422]|uniref:hypothetical protein n=1 Tax=Clostridium TaxID=1485 RepID=UPI00293DD393|nr:MULTISPECIES: hypothetical protein [unclassified Clostridium]MDV4151308.1 hypothetical protein [Clostridium sp. AL.422]
MSDVENYGDYQMPVPDPRLKDLDILVGTWNVSGPEVKGKVTYEWMEGGFFLIQYVDLEQYGESVKGMEIIGFERGFGATEPSKHIKSRYYDSAGNTFDYTYEVEGDTLIIWGGEKGSPAYFKGEFSTDGNTNTGAWVYPDCGGYSSTMTRVR